jgi:hypothetical protein
MVQSHCRLLGGGISKYFTNGSKTTVMDIIGFMYVSVGSSTVQVHGSLGSRSACACSEAGFNSQIDDHAWGVYYRIAGVCCEFLWVKGLSAKDIHKEYLLFMVRSVYRVQRFTIGSRNSGLGGKHFTDEVETELRKWLKQQSNDFCATGFEALVKRWDKRISVGGGYVEK